MPALFQLLLGTYYLPLVVLLGILALLLGVIATASGPPPTKVRYERIPIEQFKLRPQIRIHPLEYLQRLCASLLLGQLQVVGCLKDFTVIWGNGRVLAARLDPKITHLYAVILEEEVSEKEFLRKQAVENFVTNPLSNAEKCKICCSYIRNEPAMLLKDIANDLGVDPAMISKWRRWEECEPCVQAALEADQIVLNTMVSLSQLPRDQQAAALAAYLNPKKGKKSNGAQKKWLTCELPSGSVVKIGVEGDELPPLSDCIEELTALLKEMKKSEEQNVGSKAFTAVLRDKAQAS